MGSRPGLRLVDAGHSLVSGRAGLEHRAVVLGAGHEELVRALTAIAEGQAEQAAEVVRGVAGSPGGVVFVFPGQGSQWVGMAAGLLDASPVFAGRM
ncbi:acyltransferase domain-containing protein, partial [Streptomyces sp. DSM 41493]